MNEPFEWHPVRSVSSTERVPLHPKILSSLYALSSGTESGGINGGNMTDWIDEQVYPRFKYRERYMEPAEDPFA